MFLISCLLVAFVAQSVGLVVGAAMDVQVILKLHFERANLILSFSERCIFGSRDVSAFLAVFRILRVL